MKARTLTRRPGRRSHDLLARDVEKLREALLFSSYSYVAGSTTASTTIQRGSPLPLPVQ